MQFYFVPIVTRACTPRMHMFVFVGGLYSRQAWLDLGREMLHIICITIKKPSCWVLGITSLILAML